MCRRTLQDSIFGHGRAGGLFGFQQKETDKNNANIQTMSFGIAKNVRSGDVQVCTPGLFKAAIDSPHVAAACAEIEDALEACRRGEMSRDDYKTKKAELKKCLPVFTPHATFKGGRRCNAAAVPSGLSMYDIDHIPAPADYYKEHITGRVQELGIVLAHITPSLEGLRLFFVMPEGMTLEEAQRWMSFQLHDKRYDSSVKDYARSSFIVPRRYILYVDEEGLFRERKVSAAPAQSAPAPPAAQHAPVAEGKPDATQHETPAEAEPLFKGIPYARIIGEWLKATGGEPVEGERNDRLFRLAGQLRYITNDDEALLLRLMPRYGLGEEEMRALVHSACSSRRYTLPRAMREAISAASAPAGGFDPLPPPMPKVLPPLVELLTSCTPEEYKPAVAHAIFPALAAHLHRVRFNYIDNVEHEATLMNVLMAGTGAGKDCISRPIDYIMDDIRRSDEANLLREEEWKNEVNSKGANKDKRKRPEGLVIQEIDADMTNPAFVMRMAEADGHFLYTKLNEIEQFDSLKGSARGGQQFLIMCLAFDPRNRYGQTRVGAQSVTKKVTIRFNFNAVTTIKKGRRYFRGVLTDGPVSRINFCTIPEREIGADMLQYGRYPDDFGRQLAPYVKRLCEATGVVECPEAWRLAWTLKEENAETARLTQSRVYENLSFRANVIAWLKACVLCLAHGGWDASIEEFVRWSLRYDLWCKMSFFGAEMAEEMEGGGHKANTKGPRNLLESLPAEFTLQEAEQLRRQTGMGADGTRNMLHQWVYRGYILQVSENRYKNLKYPSGDVAKTEGGLWN